MARHMSHYFDLLGLPHRRWARGAESPPPERVMEPCDVVLLLVSDASIAPFVDAHPDLTPKRLIHFSGSLVTESAQGMHPLCTFPVRLYPRDVYVDIPFIYESGRHEFQDVFPALPNPCYPIDPADKALYHGVAVLAGNFTTVLWQKLFATFAEMGLPREAALPYLEHVHRNLAEPGGDPVTGPLSRGDRDTVAKNLTAFGDDRFAAVYRSVVLATAPELLDESP